MTVSTLSTLDLLALDAALGAQDRDVQTATVALA